MQAKSPAPARVPMSPDNHIWPLSLVAPEGPRGLAFKIQGIGEQAPRRPGLFIYAARTPEGVWRALYVGESDNLRTRLAFNEIAADAMLMGASDVHIRELSEPVATRRELVDRLIATNAPPLNSDERVRFTDIQKSDKAARNSQVA